MSVPIPIVNSVFQPIVTEALGPTKDHIRYTVYCTKHVRDMRRNIDKLNVAKDDVESHKNRNEKEGREIPSNVVVWLEKVKRINGLVEKMPIDIGCFCNFYTRHKIGREAFKIYEEINYILEWNDQMKWTDNLIPPGRIPSTNASISSTPFTDPQASTSSAPSSNHQASTSSLPSIIHRLIKKNKKKSSNHQASTISTPSTNHQSSTSSAPSSNHQASTSSAPSTHHQASTSCAPSSYHQASTSSAPSIDHQASTISAPSSNHQASTSYAPSTDHQASTSCAPSSNHQASTSSAPSIDHQASTSSAPSTDHQASTSSTPSSNHQASTSSAPSTDHQASTSSTPSTDHRDEFPSRKHIISEALKALESNRETHMVALCGMGGVGKTKMIQRLKKIVIEQKMFDWLVEVDIGPKTDIVAIQSVVAYYLGVEIKDTVQEARIDTLRKWFKANSGGGETKFLIILDDVWERLNLNDIGLSPLPNQGVNFKVLLTSQDRNICNVMRVEANLTLTVNVLTEEEAKGLFSRAIGNFDDVDWELKKIGEDIVKKCSGLPSAIEKMAVDLKNKGIDTWKDTLSRLEVHDVEKFEPTGFKRSLNSLAKETLSIFLLCGLFSTFIPTEELLRYGCGLKLFERVCTIKNARIRLSSKIEELKHKFLLIESDDVSCIKMHDLMLSVVLNMVSKGEHASFVRYGSIGEWPEDDMSIYKRIISTCEGMTGFPEDLTFPNLSMLKLMQGDDSLRFPSYFYKEMKELKVIAYDNMKHYPAIRGCSINLRVLHLHQCSLNKHDFSSIGNLYNLEVLSFAKSKFQCLPSIIGKLKKLMLLDLTDCSDLRIDEGVLRSLGKLEELYAIAGSEGRNALRFTNDNLNEMAKRSKELSALEFEFIGSNILPENISFENLQRFKISVGRSLDGGFSKSKHSYENTLQLVSNMADMANYKMNELFKKTKVLCLSVEDMNDLENIEVNSAHLLRYSSFRNLRVLVVSECEKLKYLFTLRIAKDLSQLEHLEVDECNDMEELIRTNGSGATITFPRLKSLSLRGLSKLSSLHRDLNTIELPRLVKLQLSALPKITNIYPVSNLETSCLLKKEIVVPKLEELQIEHLDNLKEIWPCDFTDKVTLRVIHVDNCDKLVNLFPCNLMLVLNHLEEIQVTHCRAIKVLINNDRVGEVREEDNLLSLRRIQVKHCDNLVNLFPDNPMSLLHHLEDLHVENCSSIELLFNIDLDCGSQIGEGCNNSSLSILVKELGKLREVWRIKGESNSSLPIRVKTITINECTDFRNVVTPTSINFNLGTPEISIMSNSGESGRQ